MKVNSKEWRITVKKVTNSYVGNGLMIECYKIGDGIFGGSFGPVIYDSLNVKNCIGKYKAEKGDHYKIVETVTKKIYYHRTYKVYYNGKIISNNDKIRIYNIY